MRLTMIMKKVIAFKLTSFAIGLGIVALLSSFIIVFVAYTSSINKAEKNLYKFYTEKAQLIHAIIETNNDLSDKELLKLIEETYNLSENHPNDE